MGGSASSNSFFSDSERAVLLLMKVQLALGSRWVSKRDLANALSKYGLNFEEALKSLEKMGYIISVGYKGSHIMLTTKGKNIRFDAYAQNKTTPQK
jgi:Mn-dependent DtxR family transcriptional regulator